jgi:hypothetical protein
MLIRIIVGVKYCFRYNQRNRQRMAGEDPDAVDMTTMPRAHRRRREKKLMTIEEVNEKFPLMKYKTWRSNRAEEGLPTAGGINTTSRPASLRNVDRESTEVDVKETEHGKPEVVLAENSVDRPTTPRPKSTQSTVTPETPVQKVTTNDEDDDDEERIQTAIPAEQLPDPGDACAICIDTIDDDDDVRGLSCGHAFHASCVDPWLTSRRACCPLCKADYYVPKPRPEAEPAQPPNTYTMLRNNRRGRPAMVVPGRFLSIIYHDRDRHGFPVVVRQDRPGQQERERRQARDGIPSETMQQEGTQPTWRSRLGGLRFGRRQEQPTALAPEVQTTPSQLEAATVR